jgi:hypothetical protein
VAKRTISVGVLARPQRSVACVANAAFQKRRD